MTQDGPAPRAKSALFTAGLLAVLFGALGFSLLDAYNVTWDEALGDFFFGERYLDYLMSFDARYLEFEEDVYPQGHSPDLRASPFRHKPWEYYPFANVLAAATSRVLSGRLGLLDSFDGFHALGPWLGALFLFVFCLFVERYWSRYVAIVTVCLFVLSPRLVVHALANIKDFPETVFFAGALFAFFVAWERASVVGTIAAGGIWGLALATKANALFVPLIVAAVVLLGRLPEGWLGRKRRAALALLGAGLLGALMLVLLWPWLWPAPIARFSQHLDYVSGQVFQVRQESLSSPLGNLLLTTPLPLLAMAFLGALKMAFAAAQRDRRAVLLLAWVAVVLGRLYLPGAVNFDGVRHFLEVFPALALLAGVGSAALAESLARNLVPRMPSFEPRKARSVVAVGLASILIAGSLASVLRSHPLELAYWNVLAGGLDGARARGIAQAGDYWGTSYRQGLRWLGENAEPGSVIAVPVIEHAVALVAPERLRPDLGLAHVSVPYFPDIPPDRIEFLRGLARERAVYVMFVRRDDWSNALIHDCIERLDPVASWELDDEPVLEIYRYVA